MTGAVTGWVTLLFKQYSFGRKVKSICRQKNYELYKDGAFWWIGKNKSGKYNFTVKCGDESYCVKLVGVRSKRILFGFVNEQSYEIKDYTFAILHTMDGFDYEVKEKQPYQFSQKARRLIVMVPESTKVTVRSRERSMRAEIGSGDETPEGKFFFGEKFLNMLKETCI